MRKLLFFIALTVAFALLAVAFAGGKPTRADVPDWMFTGSAPAGAICPFAASSAVVVNNEHVLTFPAEPNGDVRQQFGGTVIVRYTNDETGKSIVASISGPGTFITHADGTQTRTYEGATGLGTVIPPVPGYFIVDGRTSRP
jgi:hypothetical protein